jgi:hypothetical protein
LDGSPAYPCDASATSYTANQNHSSRADECAEHSSACGARTQFERASYNYAADKSHRSADADHDPCRRRRNSEHTANTDDARPATDKSCARNARDYATGYSCTRSGSRERTLRARTRNNAAERLRGKHFTQQSGNKSHHAPEFGQHPFGYSDDRDFSGQHATAKRSAESNGAVSSRNSNQWRFVLAAIDSKFGVYKREFEEELTLFHS